MALEYLTKEDAMPRRFNVAGPCKPDIHYMLPAAARAVGAALGGRPELLRDPCAAPERQDDRHDQSGPGTHDIRRVRGRARLRRGGAAFNDDPGAAELAILDEWQRAISARLAPDLQPPSWPVARPGARIGRALQLWAEAAPRPLVLFIDEIDALRDDALISVLRQLRTGYFDRPQSSPWSLPSSVCATCGTTRWRQAAATASKRQVPSISKPSSLTLGDFSAGDVATLYGQHTAETGQRFTTEAVALAYELTQGQPWLVNALARRAVMEVAPDPAIAIAPEHILTAKEIFYPAAGHPPGQPGRTAARAARAPCHRADPDGRALGDVPQDDIRSWSTWGRPLRPGAGGLVIANPIYREVIPACWPTRPRSLPHISPTWLKPNGSLAWVRLQANKDGGTLTIHDNRLTPPQVSEYRHQRTKPNPCFRTRDSTDSRPAGYATDRRVSSWRAADGY